MAKKLNLSLDKLEPFFDRLSKLTQIQRILICVGTYAVIVAPTIWFVFVPKWEKVGKLEEEYEDLENKLRIARQKAAQLKRLQARLEEAKSQFEEAKRKLPQSKELPDLLANITASGQSSGLQFLLFEPRNEVTKDFYAEIPVAVTVSGDYRKVALFFDKLSRLPRIVNIKDIQMRPTEQNLETACTAVTYRFVEQKPQEKKQKGKRRVTRKK